MFLVSKVFVQAEGVWFFWTCSHHSEFFELFRNKSPAFAKLLCPSVLDGTNIPSQKLRPLPQGGKQVFQYQSHQEREIMVMECSVCIVSLMHNPEL
jgi:hypothetical protein